MEPITITKYADLNECCKEYSFLHSNAILFRGTADQLLPSIAKKSFSEVHQNIEAVESNLLRAFQAGAPNHWVFKAEISRDWEIRISAREHELLSSLMDWSISWQIALEFATHNFAEKNIESTSVWMLMKQGIDQVNVEDSTSVGFCNIHNPTIVNLRAPGYNRDNLAQRRKFIQGGYFLCQPYKTVLTPLSSQDFFNDRLVRCVIPKDSVESIRRDLSKEINLDLDSMINKTDLDRLCEKLNSECLAASASNSSDVSKNSELE